MNPLNIPIIINNRNRLITTRQLVEWLMSAGHKRIIILDNASTYGPLLQWYKTIETKVLVKTLRKNLGSQALWRQADKSLLKSPFVLTDSDIVPAEDCPKDLVAFLWRAYQQCGDKLKSSWSNGGPIQKLGPGFKIDDIPDCYALKEKVLFWEEKHAGDDRIQHVFEDVPIYDAAIDTTFALYLRAEPFGLAGVRTGAPYRVRHLPWYTDSANPSEEEKYCEAHADKGITNWGITQCYSVAVNRQFRAMARTESPQRKREEKTDSINIAHWSTVPCAIDMAPYAKFYQEHVKRIAARNNGSPTRIVEAGVRFGCSARIIREALLESAKDWNLTLIDPVLTREASGVARDKRVKFLQRKAEDAASLFQNDSIDLLHVDVDYDGTHPYELSANVVAAFSDKLKPSGEIILHDCSDHFPGIVQLVNEMKEAGWQATYCKPAKECPIAAPVHLKRESKESERE